MYLPLSTSSLVLAAIFSCFLVGRFLHSTAETESEAEICAKQRLDRKTLVAFQLLSFIYEVCERGLEI